MTWGEILGLYLMGVNFLAFALMGVDKRRARRHRRRIPERTLLLFPLLGGSLGGIAGMGMFCHKTRHNAFRYGLPAILAIQVCAALLAGRFLR